MATQLQIRRGTASQVAAFTGAEGEVVVNTTNDSIVVNDGSTAGGFEMARVDGSNWAITNAISTTANISFGDNDKAIFGGGSDLQIFHDGTNSRIQDAGSGNLKLVTDGAAIQLQSATENMVVATPDADVQLYYNGLQKLATTSTGIDVTGTVTADGLTVADGTSGQINVWSSAYNIQGGSAFGDMRFNAPRFRFFEDGTTLRLNIDNGDISFYNSAGTSQSLFWDSSAESLGIGTSSPSAKLQIDSGASNNGFVLDADTAWNSSMYFWNNGSAKWAIRNVGGGADRFSIYSYALASDALSIDQSGNLLVGQSSSTAPASDDTVGVAISPLGYISTHRAGVSAEFGRNNSDGDIAVFRRDGTAVGSIGTNSGNIYLSDGARSLIVDGDTVKAGYSTGGNADGAQDLGNSSVRWRNLYLSNAVHATHINLEDAGGTYRTALDYDASSNLKISTGASAGSRDITFFTENTEQMRLVSDGSLLVGKTGIGNSLAGLRLLNATGNQGVLYITKTVSGNKNAIINYHNATYVGGVNYSDTATSFQTSSDQRLKENIADADDAGSKVDSIQVRKFDWKVDGSHQDYGMIAQELQAVAPEAVSAPEDPDEMMGVDYSKLVPMLVKEIQSLRNRVAQLENN